MVWLVELQISVVAESYYYQAACVPHSTERAFDVIV